LEIIDGVAENADQAAVRIRSTIEALQTLPFFGSSKVVWLKSANFLGDTQISRAASVQSALEELSDLIENGLGSDVIFLISATEVDKRRSFYRSLVKRAELQVFDRLDSTRSGWEEEATEVVRGRVKKRKLQFDGDALDLFVLLTAVTRARSRTSWRRSTFFSAVAQASCLWGKRASRLQNDRQPRWPPAPQPGRLCHELLSILSVSCAALARGRHLRAKQCAGDARSGTRPQTCAAVIGSGRKCDRHFTGRDSANGPKFIIGQRFDGASSAAAPAFAVPIYFCDQSFARRSDRTFTAKKDGSINAYALGIAAQHAHRFETRQLIEAIASMP